MGSSSVKKGLNASVKGLKPVLKEIILDLSKLKAFADEKVNMNEKLKFVLGKTLWQKEKMLVTSIFSFSYNVFKSLLFNPLPNSAAFRRTKDI